MPISFEIEASSGVAIGHCSGALGSDDARAGAMALWNQPDWPGRAVVWDFREAQFALSADEIREIGKFILQNQRETPPEKLAFVAPRDVDFGLARMFGAFRDEPHTTFRVFRDYEDALEWTRSREP